MAVTLTLAGPTVTDAVITASNAKASSIMDSFLTAKGKDIGSMTDQQKADEFMVLIRGWVVDTANEQEMSDDVDTAVSGFTPIAWDEA